MREINDHVAQPDTAACSAVTVDLGEHTSAQLVCHLNVCMFYLALLSSRRHIMKD